MLYELARQRLAKVNNDIVLSFKQNFAEQEQLTKTKLTLTLLSITAEFTKSFGYLLQHFLNHQTHHRGQASTLLHQAGVMWVSQIYL